MWNREYFVDVTLIQAPMIQQKVASEQEVQKQIDMKEQVIYKPGNTLKEGDYLDDARKLVSKNSRYEMKMLDGTLVIYDKLVDEFKWKAPIKGTRKGVKAELKSNGLFQVPDPATSAQVRLSPLWSVAAKIDSGSNSLIKGVLEDDGVFRLYNVDKFLWMAPAPNALENGDTLERENMLASLDGEYWFIFGTNRQLVFSKGIEVIWTSTSKNIEYVDFDLNGNLVLRDISNKEIARYGKANSNFPSGSVAMVIGQGSVDVMYGDVLITTLFGKRDPLVAQTTKIVTNKAPSQVIPSAPSLKSMPASYPSTGDRKQTIVNPVVGGGVISVFSAMGDNTGFIDNNGIVYTIGSNTDGQLGDGTTVTQNKPSLFLVRYKKFQAIAFGSKHAIFLEQGGDAWGCGKNTYGQLATTANVGTTINIISASVKFKAIACGGNHSIFLDVSGGVWGCGRNFSGQLGTDVNVGKDYQRSRLQMIDVPGGASAIACGLEESLFLDKSGKPWACGSVFGPKPQMINGVSNVISIACGWTHMVFLDVSGSAWACGKNEYGQLGYVKNTSVATKTATKIPMSQQIKSIAAGAYHTLLLDASGQVWLIGNYLNGSNSHAPMQIKFPSKITKIASGAYHVIALDEFQTLWTFGRNAAGQLGNGTNVDSFVPVKITNIKEGFVQKKIPIVPSKPQFAFNDVFFNTR